VFAEGKKNRAEHSVESHPHWLRKMAKKSPTGVTGPGARPTTADERPRSSQGGGSDFAKPTEKEHDARIYSARSKGVSLENASREHKAAQTIGLLTAGGRNWAVEGLIWGHRLVHKRQG